jgi:hypothetical protein
MLRLLMALVCLINFALVQCAILQDIGAVDVGLDTNKDAVTGAVLMATFCGIIWTILSHIRRERKPTRT